MIPTYTGLFRTLGFTFIWGLPCLKQSIKKVPLPSLNSWWLFTFACLHASADKIPSKEGTIYTAANNKLVVVASASSAFGGYGRTGSFATTN